MCAWSATFRGGTVRAGKEVEVAAGKELVDGREEAEQQKPHPRSRTKKHKKGSRREMRKITTIATTLMLMLALPAGAAFAATIVGHPWSETLEGTSKVDTISGLAGDDALIGKGGNDFLYGGNGHDGLYGGAGDDEVHGGSGNDRAEERAVYGGEGNDTLFGDDGDDALYGGPGSDKMYGGTGADLIGSEGDGKADTVDCGSGVDAVKASSAEQIDRYVGCERFVR